MDGYIPLKELFDKRGGESHVEVKRHPAISWIIPTCQEKCAALRVQLTHREASQDEANWEMRLERPVLRGLASGTLCILRFQRTGIPLCHAICIRPEHYRNA